MQLYVDSKYISPYAMSVFVALHEKQLPFEVKTVDLGVGANHGADYAAASLTQRVPLLIDGDVKLSESSAITEYLHEAYPGQPLYPSEVKLKARARQVQAWLRSDLMPIRQERSAELFYVRSTRQPLSTEAQQAADKLFYVAQSLLHEGADYLCGEWCIADVDLALMLNRLALNDDPVPERLKAYAVRQWQRPSVQRWVNQARNF